MGDDLVGYKSVFDTSALRPRLCGLRIRWFRSKRVELRNYGIPANDADGLVAQFAAAEV